MENKDGNGYGRDFRDGVTPGSPQKSHVIRGSGYTLIFLLQTVVCALIILAVLVVKYTNPDSFVPVSDVLEGLYGENITLGDLTELLNERISDDGALSVFFNAGGN